MRPRPPYILRLGMVFTLAVSAQGLLFMQGLFLLRQDYVAQRLCVNRDRPALKCNGKCFLAQQLKEERRREEERGKGALQIALSVAGVLPLTTVPAGAAARIRPRWPWPQDEVALGGQRTRVYRPPWRQG